MYFVYAIKNQRTGKIYIGQTNDLSQRLLRHNGAKPAKSTSYTKRNRGTWEYFYTEELETREKARIRERQLKSAQGRKFLKSIYMGP